MTVNPGIIKIDPWLESAYGRCLLEWEQAQLDRVVADIFGFHALQVGWPALEALRANRMPHRWLLDDQLPPAVAGAAAVHRPGAGDAAVLPQSIVSEFEALPFPANSLDLVVLAHTLERSNDAHETLREVERVLVPDGRVVVVGFNPYSLLGLRHRMEPLAQRWGLDEPSLPVVEEMIGWRRLRDWLRLLGFEFEAGTFGGYRPPFTSAGLLERTAWLEARGERWWPVLGSVYVLQAVKRVRGMRLIGPAWKRRQRTAAAPAVVAQQVTGQVTRQVSQPQVADTLISAGVRRMQPPRNDR